MDNSLILSNYSNTEDIQVTKIISFWAIILTEENNQFKSFLFFLHTKSSILKTFSYLEEIINAQVSTESMDFTINVIHYLFR